MKKFIKYLLIVFTGFFYIGGLIFSFYMNPNVSILEGIIGGIIIFPFSLIPVLLSWKIFYFDWGKTYTSSSSPLGWFN